MIAANESKLISDAAANLAFDIEGSFPSLGFKFLIHRRGQRQDEVEKTLATLSGHPGYEAAKDLLRKKSASSEKSAFMGVAIGHEKKMLGLKSIPQCLAFISLNLDQYKSREEAQYALYHMVGQFFDLMTVLRPADMKRENGIILQPRRNVFALARSNMKSDIFSALMMTTEGNKDSVRDLARLRGMEALISQPYQRPEEYPYAISMDVTEFGAEKTKSLRSTALLKSVYQLSNGISRTFDRHNIETWINFTSPAQTMAWSGCTPDQILGAAIHSSPNPFIKSIGNLLAEVTQVEPAPKQGIESGFNPYVDMEINEISHNRNIEETFDMVMIHSMEADSHLPLVRVANNQNESMVKGKLFGWCAHALHAAAKAYEHALHRGIPPEQAARLEFESAKGQTNWKAINQMNDHILSQHRNGFAVTLTDLAAWCKTSVDFRPIMESIQYTLTDPGYNRKLAATHEMPGPTPEDLQATMQPAFAPSMAPMFSPQLAMGGGGFIGGGGHVRSTQTKQNTETLVTEDE